MTSYAFATDGTISRTAATPPQVFTRPNGTVVVGYNLRSDLWAEDGWLPIVDVGPQPTAGQSGDETLTVNGAQVDRTWANIADLPPSQRELLVTQATDAVSLDDLRTVLLDAFTNGVI